MNKPISLLGFNSWADENPSYYVARGEPVDLVVNTRVKDLWKEYNHIRRHYELVRLIKQLKPKPTLTLVSCIKSFMKRFI